jgi:hypothetical protein
MFLFYCDPTTNCGGRSPGQVPELLTSDQFPQFPPGIHDGQWHMRHKDKVLALTIGPTQIVACSN